jgi:hypothetical protein
MLLIPIVVTVVYKIFIGKNLPIPAVLGIIFFGCIVIAAGWGMAVASKNADVEIWSGEVTGKTRDEVSCSHSYRCHCKNVTKKDSNGKKYTEEVCDTCYEHRYDVDWDIKSTVGGFSVSRIDRQGLSEPKRWTEVKIGDPASKDHYFINYVKGAEKSLYHNKGYAKVETPVPPYPKDIYDYYKIDRALQVGLAMPDLQQWNTDISLALRKLGSIKQVNFVVVVAKTGNPSYASKVEHEWLGGKKNDVIVVIGTEEYPKISWVRVISWTDREDFKVNLREAILDVGTIDREKIIPVMMEHTKTTFTRKSMKDFEYLSGDVEVSGWAIFATILMSLVATIGSCIFLNRNY